MAAAVQQAAYTSLRLASKAVPMLAVSSSVVFAISPWQTIRSIATAKSTLQYKFAPFFFYFVQSVAYTLYGVLTGDSIMLVSSALGAIMGSHYVVVYCQNATDKRRPVRSVILALVATATLFALALQRDGPESQLLIGIPSNVLSLLTASSPLLQVGTIVRTKDASSLPFGMCVMTLIGGSIWSIYGLMLHDYLVILPNVFGTTMGLIQVLLILLYCKTPSKGKHVAKVPNNGLRHRKSHHEAL